MNGNPKGIIYSKTCEKKKDYLICCTEEINGGAVWNTKKDSGVYEFEKFFEDKNAAIEYAVELVKTKT